MGDIKFISHRGNLGGIVSSRENAPDYIDEAIAAGFQVEVDLRKIGNQFFLGHDYPQYPVSWKWIDEREEHLLIHVKDVQALKGITASWHTFCHRSDPYTLTSRGLIWLHDLSLTPDDNTIVPLMTRELIIAYPKQPLYAICSDHRTDNQGNVYNVPRGTM
jgi:hypothetical protein